MHYDIADHWKVGFGGDPTAFDIFQVTAHEIGHALGLGHTAVPGSLMNPFHTEAFSGLQVDDIAGMQFIYGRAPVHGVPEPGAAALLALAGAALAVRRFDRPLAGRRVHIEDFAQILGLYPEQKYASYNYETLANLVYKLAEESELDEFIRRLVFVVASGNGDAHLKNWSLVYTDGVNARVSPAHDFVSTIQYQADDQLALNLARSKRWQDVTRASFLRLARKIGDDETRPLFLADQFRRKR